MGIPLLQASQLQSHVLPMALTFPRCKLLDSNGSPGRQMTVQHTQRRLHQPVRSASMNSIEKGWLNPPLRFSDEPCHHKLLDLIGDLALCAYKGHPGLLVAHTIAYKRLQSRFSDTQN